MLFLLVHMCVRVRECTWPPPLPLLPSTLLPPLSLVWGVGGNLESSSWDKFDAAARELLEGTANYPQGSGMVFDYYLDASRWGVGAGL